MTPLEEFTVDGFMFTYNEVDIIERSATHSIQQGVHLHVMDNWSTDGTWEALQQLPLASLSRYPSSGPTEGFPCYAQLRMFEDLAAASSADWSMIQDADEIRRSPWPDVSLREAFCRIEQEGFNAANFAVILFPPVDDGFQRGMNPEEHFRLYRKHHLHTNLRHIKAWKNIPGVKVNIADTGSHFSNFPGVSVYPTSFILKHYPILSQQHGEKKILLERLPRYLPEERFQRGWHVQYDGISTGHNFLADPSTLELWPGH
jgi:hypothetical protein